MSIDIETARLVVRVQCDVCDGAGEARAEDWVAYREWAQRQHIDDDPEAEEQAVERYFLEVCGYTAVPAMREPCESCDGSGDVDAQLSVDAFVEFILEQIDQPVMPSDELAKLIGDVKKSVTNAALASQGLADAYEVGSWLRVVQEGGEALRSLRALATERRL